ncbi:hypothetical protein [Jonesia quinghaiensis]|uniref:hypothetical protein n=1 Tax=Jonesia quinghaiensis TaxID=262806 RepID=UPI000426FCEA|nr:hypothetical protein [Jonesia quinghaiensis]
MSGTQGIETSDASVQQFASTVGPALENAYRSAVLGDIDVAQEVIATAGLQATPEVTTSILTALADEVVSRGRSDAQEGPIVETVTPRFTVNSATRRNSDQAILVDATVTVATTYQGESTVREEVITVRALLNGTNGEVIDIELLDSPEDIEKSTIGQE